MGRTLYFVSIAFNSGLWTFIAAASIASFVYSNDPESMEGWGLMWFFSLPVMVIAAGIATLTYPAYRDAESIRVRALLYLAVVLAVGLAGPFGFAVLQRLLPRILLSAV